MLRSDNEDAWMKILVIDDHVLIREALRSVLAELNDDVSLLEACDYRQMTLLIEQHPEVNLVLLDLNLPDRDGFAVLAELRERHPATSVVVLSALKDRMSMIRALDLGALGFIPKTTPREIMLSALRLVVSGGIYVPAEILADEESRSSPKPLADDLTHVRSIDLGLTARQIEVLALMAQGRTNKAISRTLNMAGPTVKNHITAILKALKVSNRTEAVITVGKLGLKLPRVDKS
jgi:DNA-binding NarL/FixJ family response regulator